jgi:hypothetical protein
MEATEINEVSTSTNFFVEREINYHLYTPIMFLFQVDLHERADDINIQCETNNYIQVSLCNMHTSSNSFQVMQ